MIILLVLHANSQDTQGEPVNIEGKFESSRSMSRGQDTVQKIYSISSRNGY